MSTSTSSTRPRFRRYTGRARDIKRAPPAYGPDSIETMTPAWLDEWDAVWRECAPKFRRSGYDMCQLCHGIGHKANVCDKWVSSVRVGSLWC